MKNEIILKQLIAGGFVEGDNCDHFGRCANVRITMKGITEVDKMDRQWFKWFVEEHPAIWSVALLAISALLSLVLGIGKDLIFKQHQDPPVINNIIKIPEKHD